MAELAAKIRARFKRRPSAIGSLLSSRSTGSHTSSSHRSPNADHHPHKHLTDPDADHDPDSKSRAGSSRVSVLFDLDGDDDAHRRPRSQPQPGRDQCAPDMVGHPGLGEGEGEGESKGEEGLAGDDSHPPPDQQHHQHQSESGNDSPISPAQHEFPTGHQTQNTQNASSLSSSSPETLKPTAPAPAQPPAQSQAEASAGSSSVLASSPEPPAPAPAPAVESEPESAAPAPEPEPAPATAASSEGHLTAIATATASDMPGNDRHPSPRKLSCISEHPSPDHQEQVTKSNSITAHPPQPPITRPAALTDATSVPAPKPDDAGDKPAAAAAAPPPPRTPKLAPAATQRPFHIPLPTTAVVPPSAANLSPNAAYSPTPSSPLARNSSVSSRPAPIRRQSLLSNRQSTLIQTLLRGSQGDDAASISNEQLLPISGNMVMRKIWVKRPGASATLVTINEDDLVDDVRDMILRKYANSLGRQFDSPDLTLRIRPNGNQQERMLGPEEPMSRTLDAYFPSGQTVDDALIIDVPLRRTPRASPRGGPPHAPHMQYYVEEARPSEAGNDYFGPGAISTLPVTVTAPSNGPAPQHAISILQTGHAPQIPSPGGTRARTYRERPERPRLGRQHTSSPTLINMASGTTHQGSIAAAAGAPHDQSQAAPAPPAIPTPPAPEGTAAASQRSATPPPRVSSPRPKVSKKKKPTEHPSLPKGMLNGSVPPINVLIVEDNIINLKLLEAFVKRLKVRWSTAMNGRDAVNKWRGGGFHLVLMDIQLPVMSGLDATREIRRLERVNSIGVFSSAASAPPEVKGEPDEKDKLENMDLFKSPVIIVALTASSLQSDRHEALAAGCNDFLTKPVNFVWLERKVMEWGCMQALIDFDGWRKWKDFSAKLEEDKRSSSAAAAQKAKVRRNRSSMSHQAVAAGA
ncbi:hypothetical protein N8I77_010657 [Diaporthe amygdali]|uniref:Response regulatory domain-containing protein n=1 Tax=Phomopsis amygdali TaxID=1214568 RepID=A0AAD9S7N3_PHOAM|nr:hypothetical protein N8I77_010657 [Diaporthe amygdali]